MVASFLRFWVTPKNPSIQWLGFRVLALGGGGGISFGCSTPAVILLIYIYISCITLKRTLNYGNYGLVLFMGNAGFTSSTVVISDPCCGIWGATRKGGAELRRMVPEALGARS